MFGRVDELEAPRDELEGRAIAESRAKRLPDSPHAELPAAEALRTIAVAREGPSPRGPMDRVDLSQSVKHWEGVLAEGRRCRVVELCRCGMGIVQLRVVHERPPCSPAAQGIGASMAG